MSGSTPVAGVFQDILNISVTQADAPLNLPVNGANCVAADACGPASMQVPPVPSVAKNWAVTEALSQATPEALNQTAPLAVPPPSAPENSIENEEIVTAETPEASLPLMESALVPPSMAQMPPRVSPPFIPQIAAQATTASVADAADVPVSAVQMAPAPSTAENWAVTEILPQATAPEARNQTATIVVPPPSAPENSVEKEEIVAAETPEASLPLMESALVPPSMVPMPPRVSAPFIPQIAAQATTASVADAADVPIAAAQIAPSASTPAHMPVTPLAPQARKLPDMTGTPKPVSEARPKWLSRAPQAPVVPMPDARPDATPPPVLTTQHKPQMPGPVPAPNLGVVDDRIFSFETPSGINATQAYAPTAPSASAPIAELRQLVIAADGEWVGALARDIVQHAARDNQLTFTLVPEHLGQLDVAMTTDNGKVDIRLETSTHAAAQAIAAEQARLIEDLRHAGLKLGQFDMSNRQNRNGQQQAPRPDSQHTDNDSTAARTKASSKAQGRFA
jgi:flagellar hook-length control protein FliK